MSIRWPRLDARVAASAAFLAAALGALAPSAASAARSCADWHAELVGVEGSVALRRAGTTAWVPTAERAQLCFGDTVRSEDFSRATVVLPDNTMLRLDALTTITLDDPPSSFGTFIRLMLGALHIMSRDPRSLTISTPHVNAGLEGTEFDIRIAENNAETEVAVLEGKVRVTNATGAVSVASGNVAAATSNGVPVITPARAVDLMRWASYYQPLFVGGLPSPSQEPTAAEAADPMFFAMRAAARLQYGRLDDAGSDIAASRALAPSAALGYALESVMALARGDQAAARSNGERARAADATSVPNLLALSYAQEAGADLVGAVGSVEAARALEPNNTLVWTRRAQLALARGDVKAALASAEQASLLDPEFAGAYTALGFTQLSTPDNERAVSAFERSIALDQSAPLARLGLGLALFAQGQREAGRRQMEIAATLDPASGLIRAYLGRTYDAEHRDKLTDSQFALSKDFDPSDPTPWLYDAVSTRGDNRPVEGLENLRSASARNGNQAPFRSRLLVDDDFATRSTGANSRVYRDLGFEQLGLLEGIDAMAANPADYAGHRLASGLYSALPRGEVARVSEVLIATLLEPATLAPIQPQLGQPTQFIANSVGPSELVTTELSPVLTANGLRFQGSIVGGANDTHGDDLALGGLHDRTSFSVGQYRWTSDGFRQNNDIDSRIANAEVKFRATPVTTLFAELRSTETDKGQLALYFDPADYAPTFRAHEETDSVRIGIAHRYGDDDTLIASVLDLATSQRLTGSVPGLAIDQRGQGLDLQEIHRAESWRLQTGVAYAQRDGTREMVLPFPGAPRIDFSLKQAALYAYAHVDLSHTLQLTVGASADTVESSGLVDDTKVNPKLGLLWHPTSRLGVRAAFFETFEGSLTTSREAPQPRLEPTEIAGFTQFLFATVGDRATVSGLGVDLEVGPRSFVGAELSRRDVDYVTGPVSQTREETQNRAYFYWTPTQKTSISAQYQYDRFLDSAGTYRFTEMRTQRLPVELRYFGAQGFTAGIRTSWVHQEGIFGMRFPFDQLKPGEDSFSVVDLSVGYRLPKRRGVLSFNVDNAFDEDFRFQDVDPENPSIMPERMAYLRFTLSFE